MSQTDIRRVYLTDMDAKQFHTTVVPLYRELYAMAFAVCGDRDDACDIVQDAMVKLWNSRDSLDTLGSIKAYAVTVLRRTAIDVLRRRRPVTTIEEADIGTVAEESYTEDIKLLHDVIKILPDRQRRVVTLSAIEGYDPAEISEMTGLSPGNVRQILSRGRRKIKEIYLKIST